VGQGGIQLGNAIWEQYCVEHKIDKDGTDLDGPNNKFFSTFFEETQAGQYVPRNLCVDLEPTVIDEIRRGPYQSMFHPEFLINGKDGGANNFARGHYTVGKEMMDVITDRIRKMVDNSENVQGFIVNHSVGGGTGSGTGMLILERLAMEYKKKSKIGFEIFPSPNISNCIVEPYNSMLSTHWLLDHTDISILVDNESIYEICKKKLEIKRPTYLNLNRIISKVVSSMTASLRFEGELNVDMNEFQTNLVPFPRLHFMTASISPIIPKNKSDHEGYDCRQITSDCLQQNSFLIKYGDFDIIEDKYMAISLNYRGNVKSKISNSTVQWLKKQKKVSFVDWCPTGFKIGLNSVIPNSIEDDDVAISDKSVVMIGNNVAINRVFQERCAKKFDLMYSQRAYVHWYVGEGMEEGEFNEARDNLEFLDKDYKEVLAEQSDDIDSPEVL
jgi:tubulin alpha